MGATKRPYSSYIRLHLSVQYGDCSPGTAIRIEVI